MIKTLYDKICKNYDFSNRTLLFISAVITFLISYYINPFCNVGLSVWDRSFSPATINSISISKRISNIYGHFFFVVPILFLVVLALISHVVKNGSTIEKTFRNLGFILSFSIFVAYISRFLTGSETSIANNIFITSSLIYFLVLLVTSLFHVSDEFSYDDFVLVYINHLFIILIGMLPFSIGPSNMKFMYALVFFICFADCLLLKRINESANREYSKACFYRICSLIYYSIALWVIIVETIYILTYRGISIGNPIIVLGVVIAAFGVVCLAFGFYAKNLYSKGVNYFGIILSVLMTSLMGMQYKLTYDLGNLQNLFELENRSIVLETFERGLVPNIDYFPAHAFRDVLGSLVYWACGGDVEAALFANPWWNIPYVISIILLYLLIKQLYDKNWAVLFILIFPFADSNAFWSVMGFVAVLGVIGVIKNPEKLSYYILFWISLICCGFSRYDAGISIGIGCVLTGVFLSITGKISFKKCFESAVIVTLPLGIAYIAYSFIRGFNWLERIDEWLYLGARSSATWATVSFGNPLSSQFFITYELFPMVDAIFIFVTIYLLIKYKRAWISGSISLIVSIAYAFMITRSVVYNNLATTGNGANGVLINHFPMAVFFFAVFVCEVFKEKLSHKLEMAIPMIALFAAIVISVVNIGGTIPTEVSSIYGRGYEAVAAFDVTRMNLDGNVGTSRNEFSEYTQSVYKPVKEVFDLLLDEDETFVDFANATGLYALTNRVCPSYAAQTPSLLSNEPSHEYYLSEIQQYNAPLAVIGNSENGYLLSMCGTRNSVRYYKIAEYIYMNYIPLVKVNDDFVLWCSKDCYDEYAAVLNTAGSYELIDIGYDKDIHEYEIGDIAYLWANADEKKAANNRVLCEATITNIANSNQYCFEYKSIANDEKALGNYLYFESDNQLEEPVQNTVTLSDSNGHDYSILYNVKPGNNKYLIRISFDNYWYYTDINSVKFDDNDMVKIGNVKILVGD